MKVGIIIYSKTGNTLSVAKKIKENLIESNYEVNIEVIEINNNNDKRTTDFKLENVPLTNGYDFLIFGSPVNAFSLCPVMSVYLKQLEDLSEKEINCFVTQFFPSPWLGGNHAISQMTKIVKSKHGKIKATGVINWSSKKRYQKTDEIVNNIVNSIIKK